ncbi:hypothetical protein [Nocardia harenae]|uniref:hypothetical protein n=1 Tax=Nocardia harenae TaxID=358707 RepID=UPI00082B3418|nr:hypothetical protein [Nocardia harenae]
MNRAGAVAAGAVVVLFVELIAFRVARELALLVAAVPLVLVLWVLARWWLSERQPFSEPDPPPADMENGPAEMLERWQARATVLADRADGTRADWDKHLRPMLAKEFELSTGLRIAKNRRATEAAGLLQFGPELWRWVDPADSATRDHTGRAPGRAALDEILRRLQRL